jgi:hypothetical protein
MKPSQLKPSQMKRSQWIALFACAAIGYGLTLADQGHAHSWEIIPGFYSILAFVGSAVIIYGSIWLGRRFLQKREDFYDDD